MRIGIDLTPLPPEPVGAGTYILQLVSALTALPTEHQFILFSQRHGQALVGDLPSDRTTWVITADRSPSARLVWEQLSLPRLVFNAKIDVLHSLHYTRPIMLSCPSVVTFHDMTFFLYPELHTPIKRFLFPKIIRFSARHANALIAVSESTRRDAINILGLSPDRIVAIPNGISQDFSPIDDRVRLENCRNKYHLPEKFILFVGLIEPRKNLPLLLNAYAMALKSTDLPPLVLAGRRGWMVEDVFQLIDQLNLHDRVFLPGYIEATDLPLVYNLAELFVYPSNYEGFGFPPLEAMACGTPVITTAVSAMLDTVGEAGFLIPPQDTAALAQALQKLLSDTGLYQRLVMAGRKRAAEFTWENTAQQTIKVYENIH